MTAHLLNPYRKKHLFLKYENILNTVCKDKNNMFWSLSYLFIDVKNIDIIYSWPHNDTVKSQQNLDIWTITRYFVILLPFC